MLQKYVRYKTYNRMHKSMMKILANSSSLYFMSLRFDLTFITKKINLDCYPQYTSANNIKISLKFQLYIESYKFNDQHRQNVAELVIRMGSCSFDSVLSIFSVYLAPYRDRWYISFQLMKTWKKSSACIARVQFQVLCQI